MSARSKAYSWYDRFPRVIQGIGVSGVGFLAQRERYRWPFAATLSGYLERDYWDMDALALYQREKLYRVLRMARVTPYYRRLFDELGVSWYELADPSVFRELPVITKADLLAAPEEFVPLGASPRARVTSSSGSTGAPVSVPKSQSAIAHQWAVWWRQRSWFGLQRKEWSAVFSSARVQGPDDNAARAYRVNYPGREVRLSTYHLGDRHLAQYLRVIIERRIRWLHGYPSAIARLANFAVKQGADLHGQIRWLTTSSETLGEYQRDLMRDAFGVEPRDLYALAEGVVNASECPAGSMHIDEDFAYVESGVGVKGSQALIGTPLHNTSHCVLRYDTGDLAVWGTSCSCGRAGRVLDSVDGRSDDVLFRRDGSPITRISPAFSASKSLYEAQVVQYELGHAVVRYSPTADFSDESLVLLQNNLASLAGSDFKFSFEQVDRVERTGSGKVRLVLQKRNGGNLGGSAT